MHDIYQVPAIILMTLLVPAFAHLYLRNRDMRNLLWFLAFGLVLVRIYLMYFTGLWRFPALETGWTAATGQAIAILASGLFLASLSPLSFRLGGIRLLYVIPYTLPLVLYVLVAQGFYRGQTPHGPMYWALPALGAISIAVGLAWGLAKGSLPAWIGVLACALFGGLAVLSYFRLGLPWPPVLAEAGNYALAALLIVSVFRRPSPGVCISVLGFLGWSMVILPAFPQLPLPLVGLFVLRVIVLSKVAAALGLILLALETELEANRAAGERERRARREMEAYGSLELPRRRVEDFDRSGDEICRAIITNSRFSQAVLLLLHPAGMYRVCGSAGIDGATGRALDSMALRIPVTEFLKSADHKDHGTVHLDLQPWLKPGDDLERLRFTSTLATPLRGRSVTEGALLLAGMRNPEVPLRQDDLGPVEILAARLQSARSQTRMLERLIDSERYAGLGQLAGNVTQQLRNPLTVILGYAALLESSKGLEPPERKGVEAILGAARGMTSTLDSLQRVTRSPGGRLTPVSVAEMLADMERLHRSEFLQRAINFRLNVTPDLPPVRARATQLRQAVLHCLQFAMDAVDHLDEESDRTVRLDAVATGDHVQITISHSGPWFEHPERAFDPFLAPQVGSPEGSGLGLSLCATILRENRGNASAVNLMPRGAAIVLDLQGA
jgi:two-component system, NtrC family, sensor kinase